MSENRSVLNVEGYVWALVHPDLVTRAMGEIRVPAGLLEFDAGGGTRFPMVKVEDIIGTLHRGRFVGRRTGNEGLRLDIASSSGEQRWVLCDPNREATVYPGQ